MLKTNDAGFYLNVDIPPVAAVSSYYLVKVFGESAVLTYDKSRDLDEINIKKLREDYKAVVICPWQLPRIAGVFDLFVNYMSFQEMEPSVVENYVSFAQRLTKKYVLLRSSKHGKNIASRIGEVGVLSPVRTDYLIGLFDEFCLMCRDSLVYGDLSSDGLFSSEVLCFQRAADFDCFT